MKQMTIDDLIYPDKVDPLRFVAKHAGLYWEASKERLRNSLGKLNREEWTAAVREEYAAYGYAGHHAIAGGRNTVHSWTMTPKDITIGWTDYEGRRQIWTRSWQDFAEAVAELIEEGEY